MGPPFKKLAARFDACLFVYFQRVLTRVFLFIFSVLGLAGFHTYLVTSNLTTNEDIKGSFSNKRTHGNYNPFHAGNGILNCHHVLCSPLPPTLIDPRGFATEDYMSQRVSHNGATSQKNGDILAPTPSNIVMHNFQVRI